MMVLATHSAPTAKCFQTAKVYFKAALARDVASKPCKDGKKDILDLQSPSRFLSSSRDFRDPIKGELFSMQNGLQVSLGPALLPLW